MQRCWITANPAWALGIEDEVGTLSAGKRADVVVWDKHPFGVYASARWVFVDGVLRYDKDSAGAPWSDFELGQESRHDASMPSDMERRSLCTHLFTRGQRDLCGARRGALQLQAAPVGDPGDGRWAHHCCGGIAYSSRWL